MYTKEFKQAYLIIGIIASLYFFDIYRSLAFSTLPYDSYGEIVKLFLGEQKMENMWSPTFYRLAYPAIAYLLFHIVPGVVNFSELAIETPLLHLKIEQSLALTSSMFIFAYGVLTYVYLRNKGSIKHVLALLVTLVFLFLIKFTAYFGIDPMTFFFLLLGVYFSAHKKAFTIVILSSILVIEKISILLFLFYIVQFVLEKNQSNQNIKYNILISAIGICLYFLYRIAVPLAGYEFQTQISSYPIRFFESLPFFVSLKGFYLTLIPFIGLIYIGLKQRRKDLIIFTIGLLIWGMCLSMQYSMGRFVMHALPFFTLPFAHFINNFEREDTSIYN